MWLVNDTDADGGFGSVYGGLPRTTPAFGVAVGNR